MTRFGAQLAEYLVSKDAMRVLLQKILDTRVSSNAFDRLKTSRVVVLDSSFNPPHYGHYELIQQAMACDSNCHIVLLLSVNNADKAPAPASFDKRLDMIYEFGETLLKTNYSICISKSPRFVDKSKELNDLFEGNKTYVLGFDTLIRVLNPIYYKPVAIDEALSEFMTSNKFVCLTRDKDYQQQLLYLDDLRSGKLGLPINWYSSIQLFINQKSTNTISSSDIRSRVKNNQSIENLTIKEISNYIKSNNLYTSSA